MFSTQFWIFFCFFTVFHFIVNILLTKEIFSWVIEVRERVVLTTLVWCIPLVGAIYTFRKLGNDTYGSSSNSSSGISGGLMGMDEIFNPSTKYIVQVQQEEHGEVRENDEIYRGKDLEEIVVTENTKNVSTKDT